jgi:hypothetical protein
MTDSKNSEHSNCLYFSMGEDFSTLREECPLRIYILNFIKRCHEDLDDLHSGEVLKRLFDP